MENLEERNEPISWQQGQRSVSGKNGAEELHLAYSNGEAVYDLVNKNNEKALRFLLRRITGMSWHVPPFEPGDKQSAILEHLWDVVLKKTGSDPRPDVVLQAALDGQFDFVPNEVKNRLINDARKASAQKRGGDGKHVPIFDALTFDGEVDRETNRSSDFDWSGGGAQHQRPKGGRIERETQDAWLRITQDIRREELASDPAVEDLGPAAKLYRFHLEHDGEEWTDVKIAQQLGVTDRTVRNYRQTLIRFVREGLQGRPRLTRILVFLRRSRLHQR